MNDEGASAGTRLRVGYVPGVQPDKWIGRWRERRPDVPVTARRVGDPLAGLATAAGEGDFDVIFLREPEGASRSAPAGLLRIPLYTETMAVLAEKGHALGAFDSLTSEDLAGERWLDPLDPISATVDEVSAAVDLVAANVGLLVLPLPYVRSLNRRDVVARPIEGVPATRMGVAWSPLREGDGLIDEFVGIVRGRTANSSRGGERRSTRDDSHTSRSDGRSERRRGRSRKRRA